MRKEWFQYFSISSSSDFRTPFCQISGAKMDTQKRHQLKVMLKIWNL